MPFDGGYPNKTTINITMADSNTYRPVMVNREIPNKFFFIILHTSLFYI